MGARPQRYRAVIHKGDTIDELKDNTREAIVGVHEIRRKQGPEPDANIQILDVAV